MKILFVSTISNTINSFLIEHIKLLVDMGYHVDVAFNIIQPVDSRLTKLGCKIYIVPFNRSPLAMDNLRAYFVLKNIIINAKYDIIHTHTPVASFIVRMICKKSIQKVIYTAHGFHFYKGAPLINWIIYYGIEKYLSKYTYCLITITQEDYILATQKFSQKCKIVYIPGVGMRPNIETKKTSNCDLFDNSEKRIFTITSIGELNKNKNHSVVIKALSQIEVNYKYIICGEGELHDELNGLIESLNLKNKVILAGFRTDVSTILQNSDLYIHPSYREGLSVAIQEAMYYKLPILACKIRGNTDLVIEGKGGYLIQNANDSYSFVKYIQKMICMESTDREKMGDFNSRAVVKFLSENVDKEMYKLYSTLLH